MPEPASLQEAIETINRQEGETIFNSPVELFETLDRLAKKGLVKREYADEMKEVKFRNTTFRLPVLSGFVKIPKANREEPGPKIYCQNYGKTVYSCEQVSNVIHTSVSCDSGRVTDIVSMKYETSCDFRECLFHRQIEKLREETNERSYHF